MFYSYNLLSHKRGKFAIVWLAATRGEKFLTKKDVNPVDLCATCEDIIEHISCRKDRISLYLSAQLTMGVCRVYRKKAIYILAELQELYLKSLRVFQPDLTVTITKKSPSKNRGRGKQNDTSFTSRIDLHPTNAIPETREDFGMLVLPAGIDPVEGPRGDGLPFLNDWILSQIPSDSVLDVTADQSMYRDPNQARPEDITLLEDKLPAPNLLDLSLADNSMMAATGGPALDELQLPPMNMEFFGPEEERLLVPRRERSEGAEEAPKSKRPRIEGRKEPKIIHVETVVTVDVHPEPQSVAQTVTKEEPGAQDKQVPGAAEEATRPEQQNQSIQLFQEPTTSVLPVENLLEESMMSTQTRVVTETPMEQPQEQVPGTVPETVPGTEPDAAVAGGASAGVSVVISDRSFESQLPPSSVERLLQQPVQSPPRRRVGRRRRLTHLIVDSVTTLARDVIRARLVNDGRDLLHEIEFAPVRVLPGADWLLSHPANHNFGNTLQRLVRERMILCSQAPAVEEPRPKRRRKQPELDEEKEKPRSPSNLSDVERRRGGKDSFMQTPANVSDVSIQPNTSLMGNSIIASSSQHQSMVLKPEEPTSVVEERPQQQEGQSRAVADQEEQLRREEEQRRLEEEQQRIQEALAKELLQQQPPQLPEDSQQQQEQQEGKQEEQEEKPRSTRKLKRKLFEESDVWRRLIAFAKETVMWSELCPRESTNKKDAATAFVAILEFTKKGLTVLRQTSLFGDITIVIIQH